MSVSGQFYTLAVLPRRRRTRYPLDRKLGGLRTGLDFVKKKFSVGFESLTAVVMKSTIFWDITPCSPLKINRRFGGIYCLHFHGRISRERYHREAGGKFAS
jgi:hypothetical protein